MKTTNLILLALLAASLAGCADDPADPDPAPWSPDPVSAEPSYNSTQPASVTGLEFVAQLEYADGGAFPSGSGIWVYGDTVYGSALGNGFFIADISDPAAPRMLFNATVDQDEDNNTATSFSRDADLIAHDDGRLTLVLATQGNGMHLWNVTDPTMAELASIVTGIGANHNVAVIPGTELVFNSQSGGAGNTNEIIDASDPYNARLIGSYGTHGCHDIAFYGMYHEENETMGHGHDKFRAYCAGIDRTEIWNLEHLDLATGGGIELVGLVEFGPESPIVGNPALGSYPIRTLHHLAMVNEDASILIIGDEQNGGGSPGACYVNDGTTDASTPFGALWFYDLSDETAPTLLNWISAPTIPPTVTDIDPLGIDPTGDPTTVPRIVTNEFPNCTAHFGSLVPGEEKLVMAWYSAGVLLIDFSDVSATNPPTILDQYQPDPTNPWDARIHGGYVFTGDIVRGMDVLRLV